MNWYCEDCDVFFRSAFPTCPWCGAACERGETDNLEEVVLS